MHPSWPKLKKGDGAHRLVLERVARGSGIVPDRTAGVYRILAGRKRGARARRAPFGVIVRPAA